MIHCIWVHGDEEPISFLWDTPAVPISQLPKTCGYCQGAFIYADVVLFMQHKGAFTGEFEAKAYRGEVRLDGQELVALVEHHLNNAGVAMKVSDT